MCNSIRQMALFAVFALKDSTSGVDEAITRTFPGDSYRIEPGKWIVNADTTTGKELSTKLGLINTHSHFVLPVRGYFGRAQPDLWEWLAAQAAKKADA
jgi:hypothetical protein